MVIHAGQVRVSGRNRYRVLGEVQLSKKDRAAATAVGGDRWWRVEMVDANWIRLKGKSDPGELTFQTRTLEIMAIETTCPGGSPLLTETIHLLRSDCNRVACGTDPGGVACTTDFTAVTCAACRRDAGKRETLIGGDLALDRRLNNVLAKKEEFVKKLSGGRFEPSGDGWIHHALPCMPTTSCGKRQSETGSGTPDLTEATCPKCIEVANMAPPTDARLAAMQVDMAWLRERGEDLSSLRGLVEAVEALHEKVFGGAVGQRGRHCDTRVKSVNFAIGHIKRLEEAARPDTDEETFECDKCSEEFALDDLQLVCPACVDRDPDDETKEDVPLGGLSHEDAHRLISGVDGAADMLDKAKAWPDDARKVARYLRELRK